MYAHVESAHETDELHIENNILFYTRANEMLKGKLEKWKSSLFQNNDMWQKFDDILNPQCVVEKLLVYNS